MLAELGRRGLLSDVRSLFDPHFKKQTEFIKDPSRLKAALCTRRAGKSMGAGIYLCQTALENAGVSLLYIALTRDSAKRIMFKDVLQHLNHKEQLGAKFNHVDLTMTFPNGAVVYLVGMDHSDMEAEKVLGQKFKLIIIDEAASFRRDLKQIIYGTLKPATVDLGGTICMVGTPGNFTKSYFYDVTEKAEPGWSVHKWTTFDNPYMRENWQAEIEDLCRVNPRIVETPSFIQNFLGRYVIDQSKLCYAFRRERDMVDAAPAKQMLHVFGIDLGYNDSTAIVVMAYSHTHPQVIVKEVFKQAEMTITDVAARLRVMVEKYKPVRMRVDNASKQAVEELEQRYQLPLTAADKTGKADFMELMNAEFIANQIVLVSGECDELADEYENLIWDDKSSKRVEHPSCENHAADAALYAWRDCREHLLYRETTKKTAIDKIDEWETREAEKIERAKTEDWFEDFN